MSKKTLKIWRGKDAEYFRELHAIIDHIYDVANTNLDWSWNKLAEKAGVSPRTVNKLGERTTKYPLFRTITKLANAVGLKLELQQRIVISKKKAS